MWKPLELEVHGPINYVASPRRQCYKSVVKGTPADWPARQGLLPANGSVYPSNCFLNKPPLPARADGRNRKCGKAWTVCGYSGSTTLGLCFILWHLRKKQKHQKPVESWNLGTFQLCCTFSKRAFYLTELQQSCRFAILLSMFFWWVQRLLLS